MNKKHIETRPQRPQDVKKVISKTPGGQTNSIDGKKVSPPPKKA